MKKIAIYDSTLRDGAQAQGISYSVEDKLKIVEHLDALGVRYIEAGNPGSNPKDLAFFERVRGMKLKHARLIAFGATRKAGIRAEDDANVRSLLAAGTDAVAIFGKSWDYQVTGILRTKLDENLRMIGDTLRYLKRQGKEVIYDAEHFFDGFKANPDYALATLQAAADAGADCLCLCDTNGGTFPEDVFAITQKVVARFRMPIGIHCHNDCEMAVANSVMAVRAGATQVQGTINGWGERCGNANLISIIPALQLKMGLRCVPEENLAKLTELSRTVSEIANIRPRAHAPYVGASAFAHKGGAHVAAIQKLTSTYEHIPPEKVGNQRKVVVSELSGRGNIRVRAVELGADVRGLEKDVLARVKELENQGYQFEAAEGSFELLARRAAAGYVAAFELLDLVVISERRRGIETFCEATVKVKIGEETVHVVAEGSGPVHALDSAFHKALDPFHPLLREVNLADYKVRILDPEAATGAKTRVLVESTGRGGERWSTIGVSQNIIEASAQALVDALELPLARAQAAAAQTVAAAAT